MQFRRLKAHNSDGLFEIMNQFYQIIVLIPNLLIVIIMVPLKKTTSFCFPAICVLFSVCQNSFLRKAKGMNLKFL